MNSLLLCEADFSRLESIHLHHAPPPLPSYDQTQELGALLPLLTIDEYPARLQDHVGFHDHVLLISPEDETDDFRLRIVMPHEADPDRGLVSVLAPVSLALIGRPRDGIIAWPANGSLREMRIASIRKHPADLPAFRCL
jgi:transcription elongation GreA/GreB family factor